MWSPFSVRNKSNYLIKKIVQIFKESTLSLHWVLLVLPVILFSSPLTGNAGLFDALDLIPTVYAPDKKMADALSYGINGGELNNAINEGGLTDKTKKKWKQAILSLPYAELSDAVYDDKAKVGNWVRVDDESKNDGFHASTYKNNSTGEVVISYEGTTPSLTTNLAKDVFADLVGLVVPTSQHEDARKYAHKIIKLYGSKVSLTGHSLGGGLAQTVGAALGLKTTTFNAASVAHITREAIGNRNSGKILNIVMSGDPVNPMSKTLWARDNGGKIVLKFFEPKVLGEHGLSIIIKDIKALKNYNDKVLFKTPDFISYTYGESKSVNATIVQKDKLINKSSKPKLSEKQKVKKYRDAEIKRKTKKGLKEIVERESYDNKNKKVTSYKLQKYFLNKKEIKAREIEAQEIARKNQNNKNTTSYKLQKAFLEKASEDVPVLSGGEGDQIIESFTLTNPNNAVSLADKKRNAERKAAIALLSQKLLDEQQTDRKQRDSFERKRSNAIASKNSKIQNLKNERDAKQQELDQLNATAGRTETKTVTVSSSSSSRVWVEGNATERKKLKSLVGLLKTIKNNTDRRYAKLTKNTKAKLQKIAGMLGVKSGEYVYKNISRFYDSRSSNLARMPVTKGYYEVVSIPSTYTEQVTRLVGLTNTQRKRQNQLILGINNIDASMTNIYDSLSTLNNQRYTTSSSVQANQQKLGDLVTSYLNDTKTQIGITQENNVNFTLYKGVISMTSNALLITADFDSTNTKSPPSVGMKMLPSNHDGVFSGNYSIASKTSSDSSGVYNYLSWGTWQASSASTHTLLDGSVFPTNFGGQWLMGKVAFHIPKQGSAIYAGTVSGDYVSPSGVRSPGVMNGSIRFTSNFVTGGLTGSAHIYKNGSSWATPTFSNGSTIIEQSQGGIAHIQAGLTGGLGGGVSGGFFGKNGVIPAESGGAWYFDHNDSSSATGIYRAKKQ